MNAFRLCLILAVLAFSSCATRKMAVEGGTPILVLQEASERFVRGEKFSFPAGQYVPVIRDEGGVYYRPTAEIIGRFGTLPSFRVYVTKDGTQRLWSGTGGMPMSLDRPLPFTSQN